MATRKREPLTVEEARNREEQMRRKHKADAQRRSALYSRLIANPDFKEFLATIYKSCGMISASLPMSEFYQGRLSAWMSICDELIYAPGAAKVIAAIKVEHIEELHEARMCLMAQHDDN